MEPIFHHNVANDQVVVCDGVNRYVDTVANYTHDTGGAAPPVLPAGADERLYQPGKRHVIMEAGDFHSGGPLPWNDGNAIIESVEGLIAEKQARAAAAQAQQEAEREAAAQAAAQAQEEARANSAIAPTLVAAALNVQVAGFDIAAVRGIFNIGAAIYLDVGQYMLLFVTPQPDDGYFAAITDGAPYMTVSEKSTDYMIVEARQSVGGQNIDPAQFGIQIYRV